MPAHQPPLQHTDRRFSSSPFYPLFISSCEIVEEGTESRTVMLHSERLRDWMQDTSVFNGEIFTAVKAKFPLTLEGPLLLLAFFFGVVFFFILASWTFRYTIASQGVQHICLCPDAPEAFPDQHPLAQTLYLL